MVHSTVPAGQVIEGLNFTAFDFETANNARQSACSLGIAKVVDGQITETRHWYIKPDPFEVGFYQHRVHGIGIDLLYDKPTFPEIWPEIRPYLEGQTLVAHNLSFDLSVLNFSCAHFGLEFTSGSSFCTYQAARTNWKNEVSYRLSHLASKLGHTFKHHDALEDAIACALLATEMAVQSNVTDILHCLPQGSDTKKTIKKSKVSPFISAIVVPEINTIGGKTFVFSGTLSRFNRRDARGLVEHFGAKPSNQVDTSTDYLVVGKFDLTGRSKYYKSSKLRQAIKLTDAGHKIEIITENDFYAIVGL